MSLIDRLAEDKTKEIRESLSGLGTFSPKDSDVAEFIKLYQKMSPLHRFLCGLSNDFRIAFGSARREEYAREAARYFVGRGYRIDN